MSKETFSHSQFFPNHPVYIASGVDGPLRPKSIIDRLPPVSVKAPKSTQEIGKEIFQTTVDWLPAHEIETLGVLSPQEKRATQETLKKWGVEGKAWLIPRHHNTYKNPNASTYSWFYGLIVVAAEKHQHSPEFLHSVIMGEGMNLNISHNQDYGFNAEDFKEKPVGWEEDPLIPDPENPGKWKPGLPEPGNWYNSYRVCGLDDYGTTCEELVNLKLLDPEFKSDIRFQKFSKRIPNDHKDPTKRRIVHPATIKGLDAVVWGVSAELKRSSEYVINRLSSTGRKSSDHLLPPKQAKDRDLQEFLTYVHFNAHPDDFDDVMRKLKSDYYLKATREHKTIALLKNNALIRTATADRMRILGVYSGYGSTDFAASMIEL